MPKKMYLTASKIKSFKACQRKYELEYVEMLKPAVTSEAFTTGSNYHACLEKILMGEEYTPADPMVGVMAEAFRRHVNFKEWGISAVEQPFEYRLNNWNILRGKIDGVTPDGIVEHKTTSNRLDGLYLERLAIDDQVSLYLLAQTQLTHKPKIYAHYTAIRKPSIKQNVRRGETEEQYLQRVAEWYDDEESAAKVGSFTVVRTLEQLQYTLDELEYLFKVIRKTKRFVRNPSHCAIMDCQYRSICLDSSPELLTGFVRKTSESEELETCRF